MRALALVATLSLPVFLFYGRALSDIAVCVVDVLFLVKSAATKDWRWSKSAWVKVAGALWAWQLGSSLYYGPVHSWLEALCVVRLFLFVAALQSWVLTGKRARQALWVVLALLGGWTVLECWQQFLFHTNINGYPRWGDGALTGPFFKPRAGEVFLIVGLSGLMPLVLLFLRRQNRRDWGFGVGMLVLLVTTMILIGQRMPNLLFLFGLLISASLLAQLRKPLLIALGVGVLAVVALPVISPPTYLKLVIHFEHQMAHFFGSAYGQLYTRAAVMVADHPVTGFGYDGFHNDCLNPSYFHGIFGIPDGLNGGTSACNLHPHNYYLQVAVMAGLPGLGLMMALAALWLVQMGRALRPGQDALQAMLFVTACVIFWPIASTSSMFVFDTAGWVFLVAGFGLAASRREPVE
jgi:O-antigen ligase